MLNARNVLIYLSIVHNGDWNNIYDSICNKEDLREKECEINKTISSLKYKAVTILDDEYPDYLKTIFQPPFVLFYYGDIYLIKDYRKNLSIVGSRNLTIYGEDETCYMAANLCKEFNIVSGLARGVDGIAHQVAIDCGGKTVAVLGSGIDYCYPIENKDLYNEIKKNHLLISEYPGSVIPEKHYFPLRNRLIAAFSKGVLVTEARKRSGTMITVNYAIEYGRDVMCVPSQAGEDSGCNTLIKEGANLVENYSDVLEILRDEWSEKNPKIS